MELFNNIFIWILLFFIQVYILSKLSNKIFNLLYKYLHKVFKKDSTVVLIISFIFLPGTFIHELSHAITATLLGSRVTKFSIWPKVEDGGIKMGYAQFVVLDIFRNTLIGISPLLVGITLLYFIIINFFSADISLKILYLYLIFQISNSMFLSESDIKEFRVLSLLVLVLGIIFYIYNNYYLNNNLYYFETLVNFLNQYINFLIYLNIFFLLTLFLNFFLLGIIYLIDKTHRY